MLTADGNQLANAVVRILTCRGLDTQKWQSAARQDGNVWHNNQ